MYQVDDDGMGDDGDEDGDEEVDIEYEGIEGMEHQIEEDDGDEMNHHGQPDGQMMVDGDVDDDDAVDDEMMGEENEDDLIEIDDDRLQEILRSQMAHN